MVGGSGTLSRQFSGPTLGLRSPPFRWRGAHGGVSEYVDGKRYWKTIRLYARTIFPELSPIDAYAATMVRNLTSIQSATAPAGPLMHSAAREVSKILGALVRPRLVLALGGARKYTDPVFEGMPGFREIGRDVLFTSCSKAERPWFSLSSRWPSGDQFLYVSPAGVHPSIPHVSKEDTLEFLDQQSKIARAL